MPFNASWWNSTDYPDPSDDPNVEIVRVTGISTDTLTITRAQEGTSASTKNTSAKTYKLVAGASAKTLDDLVSQGAWRVSFDGQGNVLDSAAPKAYRPVGAAGTIAQVALVGDVSGSVTVKRYTPSGGALGSATTLGTIALSSAVHNRDTTLSGWTTSVSAGDVLEISIGGTIASLTHLDVHIST